MISKPDTAEDKLQSLRWHVINNTVNKEVLVGLIEDAIRLSRPAQGRREPLAWRVDGTRDGKPHTWLYYKLEWPEKHAEHGDVVTPLYATSLPPQDSALREHVEVLLEQLELDEQHGFGADERDCPICVAIKNVQDALAARNHSQEAKDE